MAHKPSLKPWEARKEMTTDKKLKVTGGADGTVITCASCKACCCRLAVMLMSEDDVPRHMIQEDRWGGRVMARLDDGWCAALDRDTLLCKIYECRPTICRDYRVGGSDCIAERSQLFTTKPEASSVSLDAPLGKGAGGEGSS